MDEFECYPPSQFQPIWMICVGLLWSLIYTKIIFYSGSGTLSLITTVFRCKCCKHKNGDALEERNDWNEYPSLIEIQNADPTKPQTKAAELHIFGKYRLKRTQNRLYYEPHIPKDQSILEYDKAYGWVARKQYDNIHRMRYTMKQNLSTNADSNGLSQLDYKIQQWTLYPKQEITLEDNFWYRHMQSSPFWYRFGRTEKVIMSEQYIIVEDIPLYYHNVLDNTQALDINGTYILYSKDGIHSSDPATSNWYQFDLRHDTNELLRIKIRYEWKGKDTKQHFFEKDVTIKIMFGRKKAGNQFYDYGTVLFQFLAVDGESGIDDETHFKGTQFLWDKGENIFLKVSKVNKVWYWLKRCYGFLFAVFILWQLIDDIGYFYAFTQITENGWLRYECYAFIATNTPNVKQFISFLFILYYNNERYPLYLIIIIWVFVGIQIAFIVPIVFTHFITFWLCYIPLTLWMCLWYYCWDTNREHGQQCCDGISWIIKLLFWALVIFFCYILYILLPVSVMSRLYDGEKYLDSFLEPLEQRKTIDYIEENMDQFRQLQALKHIFLWLCTPT